MALNAKWKWQEGCWRSVGKPRYKAGIAGAGAAVMSSLQCSTRTWAGVQVLPLYELLEGGTWPSLPQQQLWLRFLVWVSSVNSIQRLSMNHAPLKHYKESRNRKKKELYTSQYQFLPLFSFPLFTFLVVTGDSKQPQLKMPCFNLCDADWGYLCKQAMVSAGVFSLRFEIQVTPR